MSAGFARTDCSVYCFYIQFSFFILSKILNLTHFRKIYYLYVFVTYGFPRRVFPAFASNLVTLTASNMFRWHSWLLLSTSSDKKLLLQQSTRSSMSACRLQYHAQMPRFRIFNFLLIWTYFWITYVRKLQLNCIQLELIILLGSPIFQRQIVTWINAVICQNN